MGRILITGGQGQLGRALETALAGDEVVAPGHADLDVTDAAAVHAAIDGLRPDWVIHTAAWTNTAGCERDPDRAMLVNGRGAGVVAEECARSRSALLHISTNEVFDGDASEPYQEDAETRPINSYGRSKLEGERLVARGLQRYCIVRTSWLYGPGRISFPEKVLGAAHRQSVLRMVTDEVASPTCTVDLAVAVVRLIRQGAVGIYHFTNAGHCSRLEWARAVLDLSGLAAVPIDAVTQKEFGAPYRKPRFSALDNLRGEAAGITLRPWREALTAHLAGAGVASGNRSTGAAL